MGSTSIFPFCIMTMISNFTIFFIFQIVIFKFLFANTNTNFFFNIQYIKSNSCIIFLKFFPIIFFRWKMYSFPVILLYKRFNICYSFRMLSCFFMISCDCYSVLKTFFIFFIDEIYSCFFLVFLSNQENLYMIHHDLDFL